MQKTLKVLIGYHRPSFLIQNDFCTPIHVGRSVCNAQSKDGSISKADYDWLMSHAIGDNTGENISERNREFCECTALYWAWKNYDQLGNPDYIGFMQYRRNFCFNDGLLANKKKNAFELAFPVREIIYPSNHYLEKLHFTKERILSILANHDGIVVNEADVSFHHAKDFREEYAYLPGLNPHDFDQFIDVVTTMYPDMADFIRQRINQNKKICFQSWILSKEIFFEYMDFLFNVLNACDKVIDTSGYSVNGRRTLGYLAEILCDLFISFHSHRYHFAGANMVFMQNSCLPEDIAKSKIPLNLAGYLFYKLSASFASSKQKASFDLKKRDYKNKLSASLKNLDKELS